MHEANSNQKKRTLAVAVARRVVREAARNLGCTFKELKRAVAGSSVIPSTLVQRTLKEAAGKVGCSVNDVRSAIIAEGSERGIGITPGVARRLYNLTHSAERVALARGCTIDEAREALDQPDRRGRKPRPYDPAERAKLLSLLNKHGSSRLAAQACGLSQTTFLRRIREPSISK